MARETTNLKTIPSSFFIYFLDKFCLFFFQIYDILKI